MDRTEVQKNPKLLEEDNSYLISLSYPNSIEAFTNKSKVRLR